MRALRPAPACAVCLVGLTLMLASAGWSAPHNDAPAEFDHFAYLALIARSGCARRLPVPVMPRFPQTVPRRICRLKATQT